MPNSEGPPSARGVRRVPRSILEDFFTQVATFRSQEGEDFALVRVELDRLERIAYWHGDSVENAVLDILASRLIDVAAGSPPLMLHGGDTFVLAVRSESADPDDLYRRGWSIMEMVGESIELDGLGAITIGSVVGVAHSRQAESPSAARLYSACRSAVSSVAHLGTRRVGVWKGDTGPSYTGTEADSYLWQAIVEGTFFPVYQPIVRLATGQVVGVEALARWKHPELGFISPAGIMHEAERSGLIRPLDLAILERALADAAEWPEHERVGVNMSAATLEDPLLISHICRAIEESGCQYNRLTVEVTESTLVNNKEAALGVLASLRDLDIEVALDDFGSGYAFLDALNQGFFSHLKIDRQVVVAGMRDPQSAILKTVTQLGQLSGLSVVAEGVETTEDLRRAVDAGADLAQGFLFARPMPAEETRALLESGNTYDIPALLADS